MSTAKRRGAGKISLLLMRKREIGAAEFKTHCLEIMDEVERLGTEVVITKHRKPVARLIPFGSELRGFSGSLKGMVLDDKTDLLSPIEVEWTADESNLT